MDGKVLIPLLIFAAIPLGVLLLRWLRRERPVMHGGAAYTQNSGRFFGPDGRPVTDPVLIAVLAATAGVVAAQVPKGDGRIEAQYGGADSGAGGGDSGGGDSGNSDGGSSDGGSGGGDGGGSGGGD